MTQDGAGRHVFQLSDFVVASELAFDFAHTPGLAAGRSGAPEPDLRIELGPVPERLCAPSVTARRWQIEYDRRFLLDAPGVGRFLLDRDGWLRIEPFCDPDRIELRLHVLGTVFAAWLAMKGFVPLHAGAVETRSGAALVCGRSGAGKSTAMALLARAGQPVLAEDLAILQVGARVEILALSGQLKLDALAADAVGVDTAACKVIPGPRLKYAAPIDRATGRRTVSKALILQPPGAAAAGPIRGAPAVRTLMTQVYRPRLITAILGRARLLAQIAAAADALELFHVRRSADYTLAAEISTLLDIAETRRS